MRIGGIHRGGFSCVCIILCHGRKRFQANMEGECEDIGCGTWDIVLLLSLVVFSKLSLTERPCFSFHFQSIMNDIHIYWAMTSL